MVRMSLLDIIDGRIHYYFAECVDCLEFIADAGGTVEKRAVIAVGRSSN